jgi:hypothetical protein
MSTLNEWLPVVEPHLSAVLVEEVAKRRLRNVARYIPEDCLGVLEVRLPPREATVDLSVRLERPDQALQMIAQLSDPHIREFLTGWIENEEGRQPVWLEFDLHSDSPGLPSPLVLAALPLQVDPVWLADSLLPALHGKALSPGQREVVLTCARAVPGSARIIYAFSLRSRPDEPIRLDFLRIGEEERREFLAQVAPHLCPLMEELAPCLAGTERPHLSFDIGSEKPSRIGMEGSFIRQPNREPRWMELLDRLVERGLCTPEKREAVLAWPGYDSFRTAPDLWPAKSRGAGHFCVRALSHIKIVGELGRPPHAKAYLTFCHYRKGSADPLAGEAQSESAPEQRDRPGADSRVI